MTDISERLNGEKRGAGIPSCVRALLQRLEAAGHETYIVGGCVRDLLLGKEPSDWDVCTSAKPEETAACFSDCRILDTGIRHGTVAVEFSGQWVEITTYRIDGAYQDGRHPEAVQFTGSLEADLARRDFTINAIAYHPDRRFEDPFCGMEDIRRKELRCVGTPSERFSEDALRMMRGLRFAAVLGFSLDEAAEKAMAECCHLIQQVCGERINAELSKLLSGFDADRVLEKYGSLLAQMVPGFVPATVGNLPEHLSVRLAKVFPENTEEHLRALKYSGRTVKEAAALARLSAKEPPSDAISVKRVLAAEGRETAALYYGMFGRKTVLDGVLASGKCWSLKDLAVDGTDLIAAGVQPGRAVGALLWELLNLVIEEKLENECETLLEYIRKKAKS